MFVNTRTVTIEWGDCDPAGIVFNPRYFAWFDAATAGVFAAALGYDKHAMLLRFGIIGIPLVDTQARFVLPNRYGDVVTIDSQVTRFGRSSFDIAHCLSRDGTLSIEGKETRVWAAADGDGIRGAPIPDEVITALSRTKE